jgi:hypothetical protein
VDLPPHFTAVTGQIPLDIQIAGSPRPFDVPVK